MSKYCPFSQVTHFLYILHALQCMVITGCQVELQFCQAHPWCPLDKTGEWSSCELRFPFMLGLGNDDTSVHLQPESLCVIMFYMFSGKLLVKVMVIETFKAHLLWSSKGRGHHQQPNNYCFLVKLTEMSPRNAIGPWRNPLGLVLRTINNWKMDNYLKSPLEAKTATEIWKPQGKTNSSLNITFNGRVPRTVAQVLCASDKYVSK